MHWFPDFSTVVEIAGWSIKWYAILIVSGALLSYAIIRKNVAKAGYKVEVIDDLFIITIFWGVVGARLWYVVFYNLNYYLSNPLHIFMTWEGGLAIQGSLIFGAAYVYFFAKRQRISFFRLGDLILPHVLLAQAIGRWGNFFNQEAYGSIVSESFYRGWPAFIKNHMFISGNYRLPTFLIESALNLLGWFLIVVILKKFSEHKRGNQVFAYLMWYGVTRFFVEGFRADSLMLGEFRIAQLISILFIVLGLLGYLGFFRRLIKVRPTILFDYDGTLADTEPLIQKTFIALFEKHHQKSELPANWQEVVLGPPLEQSLGYFFPDLPLAEVIKEYRAINIELHQTMFQEIAGASDLLKYLKENHYPVGIVSNKISSMIKLGLDILELDQYVDVIIGTDELDNKLVKPHPYGLKLACEKLGSNIDNLVYVGDTVSDIVAGKNAHAFTIGLARDVTQQAALKQAQADRVISNLAEIKTILAENLIWTSDMA